MSEISLKIFDEVGFDLPELGGTGKRSFSGVRHLRWFPRLYHWRKRATRKGLKFGKELATVGTQTSARGVTISDAFDDCGRNDKLAPVIEICYQRAGDSRRLRITQFHAQDSIK